jgi:hypothetical protein
MEGRTPFCFLAAARSRHRISGDRIIGKGRLPTSNRVTVALKLAASNLRTSQSYLGAQFRRLRARLDTPVAIKAMAAKGDRRRPRMDGRAILRPHSTCEVGNRRASGKERPRYPLEGRGNKRTNLSKGNIVEAQTSVAMSTNRQTNRPGHDGLGAGRGVTPEEPTAGNLHGGVCERGDVSEAMVALNAHEAGNGG